MHYDPQANYQAGYANRMNPRLYPINNSPIIIINQAPVLDNTAAIANSLDIIPENTGYPSNLSVQEIESIGIQDIDGLIIILDNINSIFDSYYDTIPAEIAPNSTTHQEAGHIIQLYSKIGTFVKKVVSEKDKLTQEIDYVHAKVSKFKTTESDIIVFYELEANFRVMKQKSNAYLNVDPKFKDHFKRIEELVTRFGEEVKKIQTASTNLSKLDDFFTIEVQALEDLSNSRSTEDMLEKFDKVMMLTVKLVEIRLDIENAIKIMKGSFTQIKEDKLNLQEAILGAERLSEVHVAQKTIVETPLKGTKSVRIYTVTFLMLFALANY